MTLDETLIDLAIFAFDSAALWLLMSGVACAKLRDLKEQRDAN